MRYVPAQHIPTVLVTMGLPLSGCSSIISEYHGSDSLIITAIYPCHISLDAIPMRSSIRYDNGLSIVAVSVEANLALYRDLRCILEGVQ